MKTIYYIPDTVQFTYVSAPLHHTGTAIQSGIHPCDIREAFLPKIECCAFPKERHKWPVLKNRDTIFGWSLCPAPEVIFLAIV